MTISKTDTYTKFSNFILEDNQMNGYDRMVYIAVKSLCYHVATSEQFFRCLKSIPRIAERAGFSESQIKKSLKKLADRGYLYRKYQGIGKPKATVIVVIPEAFRKDLKEHGEENARYRNEEKWEEKIGGIRNEARRNQARIGSRGRPSPRKSKGEEKYLHSPNSPRPHRPEPPSAPTEPITGYQEADHRFPETRLSGTRKPTSYNQLDPTIEKKPCKKTPDSNGDPLEMSLSKISKKNPNPQEPLQYPPISFLSLVGKAVKSMPKVGPNKKKEEAQWLLLQQQRKMLLEEDEKSKNGSGK